MNERILQFRIGMFVIVAGLVLTMLIVWFEAPTLIRERRYLTVFFREAPGIDRGIPVRKSGVRVGEVFAYEFTEADQPEGVLVTLALDPQYNLRAGTIPKLGRALIGDVSIDLLPGDPDARSPLPTYDTPAEATEPEHWLTGVVATDPFVLLTDVSKIFERADSTLVAIEQAAEGLAAVTGKLDEVEIEAFLTTWRDTGQSVDRVATEVGRILQENEAELKPAVASLRSVAEKVDTLLDDPASDQIRQSLQRIASASERIDSMLAEIEPVANELRTGPGDSPRTHVGQILARTNRITYDLAVLTDSLTDDQGGLNSNGTLQRLIADPQLYEELRVLVRSADATISDAQRVLRTLNIFADKIARRPSLISEGVLNPR